MPKKSVRRKTKKVRAKTKKEEDPNKNCAVIPELKDRSSIDKEYPNPCEEKIWDPEVDVEEWYHCYGLVGRAALTYKQECQGIPNEEALGNSCTGTAEQYISNVLHESKYIPYDALQMLLAKDIPQEIIKKWKPEEMNLFTDGIMKYGKNFSIIRRELLSHKKVEDFAEFYYEWKKSKMAESWRNCRMKIKSKKKMQQDLDSTVLNLSNEKRVTRSTTAAIRHSLQNSEETDDSMRSTSTTPSEMNGQTSSSAQSTDSSIDSSNVEKPQNELPATATSKTSVKKNGKISAKSTKRAKRSKTEKFCKRSRMAIKAKQKKQEGLNNEIFHNLSNGRMLTRSATAAIRLSFQNNEETDDSTQSTSEMNEQTSSAAESTDSLEEHVEKSQNELPETATSETSVIENGQISADSTKCPNRKRKRKSSNPLKIIFIESEEESEESEESEKIEEIIRVSIPSISKYKRKQRCQLVG